eukprot:GEMP01055594.1.p1 GENE.GEMP01055594.1~~GEMP01055594.1.p1  ORF type:complete len:189 (+),score=52.35 GEMP01055594.1:102-668(+)
MFFLLSTLTAGRLLDSKNQEISFVKYYADWCPFCVKVAPIWEAAKVQWQKEKNDVAWVNNQCYKGDGSDGAAVSTCTAAQTNFFPDLRLEISGGDKEGCVHLPDMPGISCPCPYKRPSGKRVKLCVFFNDEPTDATTVVNWVKNEVAIAQGDEKENKVAIKFHAQEAVKVHNMCFLKDAPQFIASSQH